MFRVLEHWKPEKKILSPEALVSSSECLFPLFLHVYLITRDLYQTMPLRKNGESSFIHPLNVVVLLRKAKVDDVLTLCAGMLHDYVEEKVDLYREAHQKTSPLDIASLDAYEEVVFQELQQNLKTCCLKHDFEQQSALTIIKTLHLLTRHKREFYYASIANIYLCDDPEIKEKAIIVKLADRIHNILCIDNFTEQERIYQCFKNLFILNNTKQYLQGKFGVYNRIELKPFPPIEKLFNKCCKATYDAFLTICSHCSRKGIGDIVSMLQLAFRKYQFCYKGISEVTVLNPLETHPLRLFQGVVLKYDARLHREQEKFLSLQKNEIEYCTSFFGSCQFRPDLIQSIVDYKDAYSLKEVVASLLYDPVYIMGGFLVSDLSHDGRIKR